MQRMLLAVYVFCTLTGALIKCAGKSRGSIWGSSKQTMTCLYRMSIVYVWKSTMVTRFVIA